MDQKEKKGMNRRQALQVSVAASAVLLAQGLPRFSHAAAVAENRPQHATERFLKSMNCSQAVLETYAPQLGMSVEQARRVSAAFAGGMGMGAECGAVTGALMVIGLKYGKTKDKDGAADEKTFAELADFVKQFKDRHRHIGCSELLGTDMGTPEGVKEAAGNGLFTTACPKFVRSAAEILDRMIV